MLLGIWKNTEELEEFLNLPELEQIIAASREKEHRGFKFSAALKGIDIDKGRQDENEERFEAVQRRAFAKMSGKSETELEMFELGIAFDEDEEEEEEQTI